jgi:hypothetical protein
VFLYFVVKRQPDFYGSFYCLFVYLWKRAGEPKTNRTDVGIWRVVMIIRGASAEYLGLEFVQLNVDFKPYHYAVRILVL